MTKYDLWKTAEPDYEEIQQCKACMGWVGEDGPEYCEYCDYEMCPECNTEIWGARTAENRKSDLCYKCEAKYEGGANGSI